MSAEVTPPLIEEAGSATTIPPVLRGDAERRYHEQFTAEYRPVGPTENALVRDLARQAAAADRWSDAALAIERQAALHLCELTPVSHSDGDDAVLAAALSNEVADRAERHGLARHRSFHRTLSQLRDLQQSRFLEANRQLQPPPGPGDEKVCEQYLADRFLSGTHACHRCGTRDGWVLAARRSWECSTCKTQVGLRYGTVMARSAIPLRIWFDAIRWILWRPTIRTTDLSEWIGVRRLATVRTMACRIRAAMAADDASELLAGLDKYYSRATIT
jgi:hypothetical protein